VQSGKSVVPLPALFLFPRNEVKSRKKFIRNSLQFNVLQSKLLAMPPKRPSKMPFWQAERHPGQFIFRFEFPLLTNPKTHPIRNPFAFKNLRLKSAIQNPKSAFENRTHRGKAFFQ
jgi:hypothetical protein